MPHLERSRAGGVRRANGGAAERRKHGRAHSSCGAEPDGAASRASSRSGSWWCWSLVVAFVWIQRRPIATHYLKREFQRRGVTATYHLDRVGLRTQQVSNLVIGDPRHPDLVARFAQIETRLKWNGSFEVYRIVARGVRLRGRLVHGKRQLGPDRQADAAAEQQAVRAARFRARHRRQQHFARRRRSGRSASR